MRIVINEMKKIWNVRMLLIIALICLLFYLPFMSFHIKYFPNGHPATEKVYYSIELLQRYGPMFMETYKCVLNCFLRIQVYGDKSTLYNLSLHTIEFSPVR
jgi:hypothetical protein